MIIKRRDFVRSLAALGLLPLAKGAAAFPAADTKNVDQWPAQSDRRYWRWIRQQFSVPPDETYFNVGTLGSRPHQVTDTVINHMKEIEKTIAHYDYRPEHPEY